MFCGCTARVVSELVRNREGKFSHNEVHLLKSTVKVLNFRTPKMFAVITQKTKRFSIEEFVQKVQMEWQTVQTLGEQSAKACLPENLGLLR